MEKQKRPILDTAKGKHQIEAESNQKKPCRDLRVGRKLVAGWSRIQGEWKRNEGRGKGCGVGE